MKKLLSLCLIVKNEEKFLQGCLESVRGLADEIVLVDTGSTDATVSIAETFGARIFSFPWQDDFAAARNRSIDLAEGEWILVLDADEQIEAKAKNSLRALLEEPSREAYSLEIVNLTGKGEGKQLARIVRLFRNRPAFRYEGKIHEQIAPALERAGVQTFPSEARIIHQGYLDEALTARDKYRRNLALLLKEQGKTPNDPFVLFNLGQTYKLMKKYEPAEKHYRDSLDALKAKKAAPPYEGYLYFSLADLLQRQGKSEEAIVLASEGLSKFPDYSDLLFAYGQALLGIDRIPAALEAFENCLRLDGHLHEGGSDPGTTSYKAWIAIAVCQEKAGKTNEALEALQKAIDASPPGEIEGKLNRGILLSKIGRSAEGDNDLLSVLHTDENRFEAWQNLGANALQRGDFKKAEEAFAHAMNISPSPDLRFLLEKIASLRP